MKILRDYLLKELSGPFFSSLIVFTFVLVAGKIITLVELIIAKGISLIDIGRLFLYQIPSLFGYILPMSLLTAILITLGRFSQDSEIIAMKASGINLFRLEFPLILLGIGFSLFSVILNEEIIPLSRYASRRLIKKVAIKNPASYLEAGTFIKSFKNYILFIYGIQGNKLQNIRIYEIQENSPTRTIIARKGEFISLPEKGILKLKLLNGTSDEPNPKDPTKFYKLNFKTYHITLDIPEKQKGPLLKKPKEMNMAELRNEKRKLLTKGVEVYPIETEIHKKLAISFSCLAFILIGFPLGIISRRGEKAIGFGLSLLVIVLYYLMFAASQALSLQGYVKPIWAMWVPNIVTALTGIILTIWIHER